MTGLTLLTATGCRPEAWAICEKLMAAQTYAGPVRWVVVDDGEDPQPITFSRPGWTVEVARPEPFWQSGQNTQARNLIAGLNRIGSDERVAIIEDDDWYSARWLETISNALHRAEVAGESHARYYNIAQRKGRRLSNATHASLCSTAVRGRGLDRLRTACGKNRQFIDLELWRGGGHLFRGNHVVGIKGLPGRGGIGMGHRDGFIGSRDPEMSMLRDWIGEGVSLYV